MLRSSWKSPLEIINLPNFLTTLRLLLVPLFFLLLYYYLQGNTFMILWVRLTLVVIVLSDFMDGYLARLWHETSLLGSLLDPVADKMFVVTSFILLSVFQHIPAWLAILVVAKDILVVLGWCCLAILFNILKVESSLMGKCATALQFFTVCLILFLPHQWDIFWIFYLTGGITLLALLQYGYRMLLESSDSSDEG